MKTFQNLIEEVQTPGLCHHCGGCVTFCTAINYGALALDEKGIPHFSDRAKCIECGLCYSICPEIDELREETDKVAGWVPPMGRILETTVARAKDPVIRNQATDGGVVTALLIHLFDRGHIDGAIVTRQTGPFQRAPWLATTRQEIFDAAGFYLDSSAGMHHFGHDYSTYSPSVQEFRPMLQKGLRRVAMVGTPCQIKAVRKMEALGIVPSDSIRYTLGLFCSGNFHFGEDQRRELEQIGRFAWEDVRKVNLKDELILVLNTGERRTLPLEKLAAFKRYACHYCSDYAAEYADISFGGIGADEGWTTVVTRTPFGRAILADARGQNVEITDPKLKPDLPKHLQDVIKAASERKKQYAQKMHDALVASGGKPSA